MKTRKKYITQNNPLKPLKKEVIEVTERVIENDADIVVTKVKLDKEVLNKKLEQIDAGIAKLQAKRDEVVEQIEKHDEYSKREVTHKIEDKTETDTDPVVDTVDESSDGDGKIKIQN